MCWIISNWTSGGDEFAGKTDQTVWLMSALPLFHIPHRYCRNHRIAGPPISALIVFILQ